MAPWQDDIGSHGADDARIMPIIDRQSRIGGVGFVTLPCREREVSAPQELLGRCDCSPPRGHRDTAKRAVRLGGDEMALDVDQKSISSKRACPIRPAVQKSSRPSETSPIVGARVGRANWLPVLQSESKNRVIPVRAIRLRLEAAGHTPSGPSGHLPQQAGEGERAAMRRLSKSSHTRNRRADC